MGLLDTFVVSLATGHLPNLANPTTLLASLNPIPAFAFTPIAQQLAPQAFENPVGQTILAGAAVGGAASLAVGGVGAAAAVLPSLGGAGAIGGLALSHAQDILPLLQSDNPDTDLSQYEPSLPIDTESNLADFA